MSLVVSTEKIRHFGASLTPLFLDPRAPHEDLPDGRTLDKGNAMPLLGLIMQKMQSREVYDSKSKIFSVQVHEKSGYVKDEMTSV